MNTRAWFGMCLFSTCFMGGFLLAAAYGLIIKRQPLYLIALIFALVVVLMDRDIHKRIGFVEKPEKQKSILGLGIGKG